MPSLKLPEGGPADGSAGAEAPIAPAPHGADGRAYPRWLAVLAVAGLAVSVTLMAVVALLGPSSGVPRLPVGLPGPIFYLHARPSPQLVAWLLWVSVLAGGTGLTAGLVAVRRGWRPRAEFLIAGSLIAVVALMLLPPIGSGDLLDNAVYGRIAALGHSPYQMTPKEFQRTGDPMAAWALKHWDRDASPYGPLVTLTQKSASELSGDSLTRTMFYLKAWNALAFLAVALALDRRFRAHPAGRARAHLLWTVNPLMLLAVMVGGHNDVLGAVFGLLAVLAFRRADFRTGLLAGALAGVAIAMKAPFALVGLGLAIAAIRSPRALGGLALGAVGVLLPSYLIAGKPAVTAVVSETNRAFNTYQPWQLLARVVPYLNTLPRTDTLALAATVVLAAFLLWRMPTGPADLPAVRPALALTLAWLICSPQQRAWYDVMIFSLLAVMPATGLDLIALARSAFAALGTLPGTNTSPATNTVWLGRAVTALDDAIVPVALVVLAVLLVWLCLTGRISAGRPGRHSRAAPDGAVPG